MAQLLKTLDIELSALPTATSGYRHWRLELSDNVSLKFPNLDVSNELSTSFLKTTDANYAAIFDPAGNENQRSAASQNRVLACLLRRAAVGTDGESIVMTTDPAIRVSGTHLLRALDAHHRSKAAVGVMQTERDRLVALPRIELAGFDCASSCIQTWCNSLLRDREAINAYAQADVDTGGGQLRKVHLRLLVNDHEVSERMMDKLKMHPVFGRPTILARLRTKMRGVDFLDAHDAYSLEKFVEALVKSFEGYTVAAPQIDPRATAYAISSRGFDVNKAFGNVRSTDRYADGYNPRKKCTMCNRVGFVKSKCTSCYPNGTSKVPCPFGPSCYHRTKGSCVYKHDGTDRRQDTRRFSTKRPGRPFKSNTDHGRYQRPNQGTQYGQQKGRRIQRNGPPRHPRYDRQHRERPNQHGYRRNAGRQVNWVDKPLDDVPLLNEDLAKANPMNIGAVFSHEVCMLKRPREIEDVSHQHENNLQTGDHTRWLLDSGASVHVVSDRRMLHNVQNQTAGGSVSAAGGSEMKVTAVGEIHLMLTHVTPGSHPFENEKELEPRLVVIPDVWCCPSVCHQVLSTKKVTNQLGLTYVKEPDKTGILCRRNPAENINLFTTANGLEFLHGKIIMPEQVLTLAGDSARTMDFNQLLKTQPLSAARQLWRIRLAKQHNVFVCPEAYATRSLWLALHHRMGHRNPTSTCRLLRRMNVPTSGMSKAEKLFCASCAVAKATSQPVKRHINSKKIKKVAPADLHMCSHLNLDLSGPHPPSIISGYRYSLIVCCRSTRYKWCQGLKRKSDMYEELRKVLSSAAEMKPANVRFELRTDSDPMFGLMCSAWKEILKDYSANHTTAGPYRQWYNSGAERSIRTITESSKALRHAAGLDDSFWLLSQQYATFCDRHMPREVLGWESPHTVTGRGESKLSWFVPFGLMAAYKTPAENKDGCRGKLGMVVGTCPTTDYATLVLTKTPAGNLSLIRSHHIRYDQTSPAAMQVGDESGEVCVPPREFWHRILTDESVVPGFVSTNVRLRQNNLSRRTLRVHGFDGPGQSAPLAPPAGHPIGLMAVPAIPASHPTTTDNVLDLDSFNDNTLNIDNLQVPTVSQAAPPTANQVLVPANTVTNASTSSHRMRLRSGATSAVNVLEAMGSDSMSTQVMIPAGDETIMMDTSPLNVNDNQLCRLVNIDMRDSQRVNELRLKNQMLRLRSKHCVHLIVGKQFPSQTAALKACPAHLKPKVLAAVKNEIDNLVLTGTIKPVSDKEIPRRYRRVPSQMLIKVKTNPDLNVDSARLKARLVVLGNRQLPQVHYFSSTAACPKLSSIMMIMATAALRGRKLWSFDVPAAFTKSNAEPNIDLCYTSLPKDIEQIGKDGHPIKYQVTASLYGCASAPRQWLLMLAKFMATQGFKQLEGDVCVWVRDVDSPKFITIGIHVDDAIGYAMEDSVMDNFLEAVKARFNADAAAVEFFLGLNIKQKLKNKEGNGVHICQATYIRSMLIKYLCDGDETGLKNLPIKTTPLPRGTRIDRNLVPESPIKQPFRSLLGACMYAANAVRWDVKGAINALSRVAHQPHQEHWDLLIHVCHYLNGTQTLGTFFRPERVRVPTKLTTPEADNHAGTQLIAYSDSSHADLNWLCLCPDCQRKHKATSANDDSKCSTVSYMCLMASGMVDSFATVDTVQRYGSPNDSETAALAKAAKRIAHMKIIAEGLSVPQAAIPTYSDSAGSISRCTKDWINKTETRSLELRFALIRDHIKRGTIDLRKVASSLNSSDLNTKALCKYSFERLRDQWMVTLEKAMQIHNKETKK